MEKRIRTSNKEIFDKLNMLYVTSEVVISAINKKQLSKILNNINSEKVILKGEPLGDYILLKKISPINYRVYFDKPLSGNYIYK